MLLRDRLEEFEKSYDYMGNATCAADGMCQTKCPVAINTGAMIKSLRADELSTATKTNKFAQVQPIELLLSELVWSVQDMFFPGCLDCLSGYVRGYVRANSIT